MFSYDVPLSKQFIPNELAVFMERCRRMMKAHPEFSTLPDATQMQIYRINCAKIAALCSVKAESFRNGDQQLDFCFSQEDREQWKERFSPHIRTKIRKVLVTDWNRTAKVMDTDMLLTYLQLSGKLGVSVEDMTNFQLITLISLFSGDIVKSNKKLSRQADRYLTVLRRRHFNAKKEQKASFTKVQSGMDCIDELARIFNKLNTGSD